MFCAYTWPRYQVSVYRTTGPLVLFIDEDPANQQNSPRWDDAHICSVTSGAILFVCLGPIKRVSGLCRLIICIYISEYHICRYNCV